MKKLIAFAGFARAGKDTACDALVPLGYTRAAFGDIIKRIIDPLCLHHAGFSAFTQNDAQKQQIRGLLEQTGEAFYDSITELFFDNLPEQAVNGRLVRLREAYKWKEMGGHIVLVIRPGFGPATQWEADRLEELQKSGVIDIAILNTNLKEFKQEVISYAGC